MIYTRQGGRPPPMLEEFVKGGDEISLKATIEEEKRLCFCVRWGCGVRPSFAFSGGGGGGRSVVERLPSLVYAARGVE